MKKLAIITVLAFIFSIFAVSMVMAQAKPSKEPAKTPAKAPAKAAAKEPIKIGAIYDFAGGCYMYSETGVKGLKLAADEINAKGGILGRKLDVFVRDTEGKVDVAVIGLWVDPSNKHFNIMDQVSPRLIIPTHLEDTEALQYAIQKWPSYQRQEKWLSITSDCLPVQTTFILLGYWANEYAKSLKMRAWECR